MDIRKSDANKITRDYMDRILIEQRLMGADSPSIKMELFGETFASPVMMPAFSHLKAFGPGRETGMIEYAQAAKNMNIVNCIGMIDNDFYKTFSDVGARTMRIIKPYKDRGKLKDQIAFADAENAFAVGVDIDHSFANNGQYDNVLGEDMVPLSIREMEELVQLAKSPFVVKGVLSVEDAITCGKCGVDAVMVSHHHGRMPFAIPPLMVLPDIAEAVKGRYDMKIMVDCGIATGADVYKSIALGADCAAVGNAMMASLQEKGTAGVEEYVKGMNDELSMIMSFTGCRTLQDINASVLWDRETGRKLRRTL